MTKRLGLSAMPRRTHDARLAALGAVVPQRDCFAPLWEHVQRGGKTIDHEPHHTLLEVVVSMRADCSALQQRHTRLRPETALAAAWGRAVCAAQATLSRTLEALPPVPVAQLRTAVERRAVREGRALPHPCAQAWLLVDSDLTGVPAGRPADASPQGSCSGKTTVAGVSSPGGVPRSTRRTWWPWSSPAPRPARPGGPPRSRRWRGCEGWRQRRGAGPGSGWTAALAQPGTATGLGGLGIPSWAKETVAHGPTRWPGVCRSGTSGERESAGWLQRPHRSPLPGAPRPP